MHFIQFYSMIYFPIEILYTGMMYCQLRENYENRMEFSRIDRFVC